MKAPQKQSDGYNELQVRTNQALKKLNSAIERIIKQYRHEKTVRQEAAHELEIYMQKIALLIKKEQKNAAD